LTSTWSRQQWAVAVTAAETARGATDAAGLWKEVKAVQANAGASITVLTDANIVLAKLFKKDGTTAVTDRTTLKAALDESGATLTI